MLQSDPHPAPATLPDDLQRFELLAAIGRELYAGRDVDSALRRVMHLTVAGLNAEDGSLALANEHGEFSRLLLHADATDAGPALTDFRAALEQGLFGRVLSSGEALVIQDAQADVHWSPLPGGVMARSARSVLAVPLRAYDQIVGVVCVAHRSPNVFDERHQALLAAIAEQIAGAVQYARLQVQAAQSHEDYRSLFEESGVPIVITDLEGGVLDANPPACQLVGWSKDQLMGRSLRDGQLPPVALGLQRLLEPASQSDQVRQTVELRAGDKDLRLSLAVRQTSFAGRPALQWLIRDQTAHLAAERTRDEQIYMIVHDLRNPLGNITSSMELLRESISDPNLTPSPTALVNIALRSSRRISLLIESLMDMTRMEAGQFTLSTTTARLDTLIERAVDFVKPTADRKRIPLTVKIQPDLPPVLIDVNMIERVVVNLLDNATKFVTSGKAVEISAGRSGPNEVAISIRDEGPGIAPEDRPRLFQKFSRGTAITGQTPGTGLGLAFCKLAVEAHGGRISVDSAPGKGSTFTFTLPVE